MVVVVVCGGSVLGGDYMKLALVMDFREVMWTSPPQIGPLAGGGVWGWRGGVGGKVLARAGVGGVCGVVLKPYLGRFFPSSYDYRSLGNNIICILSRSLKEKRKKSISPMQYLI